MSSFPSSPVYNNQLADPSIMAECYGLSTYRPPTPLESAPSSNEEESVACGSDEGQTQAFFDFVGGNQDPVLHMEFSQKVVSIIHEGAYTGPAHIISREAYEKLEQNACPLCRREILGARDLSRQVSSALKNWSKVSFKRSGDNCMHKAAAADEQILFFALLCAESGPSHLFSKNKKGKTPFDLLEKKVEFLTALKEHASSLNLKNGTAFAYYQESLLFCENSKIRFVNSGDSILVDEKLFVFQAMDLSCDKPCLYFLNEANQLFKLEEVSTSFDFSIRVKMPDETKKEILGSFPLMIGRDQKCPLQIRDSFVSRFHWIIHLNEKNSRYEISQLNKKCNPSLLKRGRVRNISTNPEPLEANDLVCIGKRFIFSIESIALKDKCASKAEGSKRRRIETL